MKPGDVVRVTFSCYDGVDVGDELTLREKVEISNKYIWYVKENPYSWLLSEIEIVEESKTLEDRILEA